MNFCVTFCCGSYLDTHHSLFFPSSKLYELNNNPFTTEQGIYWFSLQPNMQTAWLSLQKEPGNKSTGRICGITKSSTNFIKSLKAYNLPQIHTWPIILDVWFWKHNLWESPWRIIRGERNHCPAKHFQKQLVGVESSHKYFQVLFGVSVVLGPMCCKSQNEIDWLAN